ncbi:bifunctional folylpolyglutamate synthase/dihydrofolate synthase, partial [Pelagibacteraceae bacterium]|nr:bifunctional folylpolyglutamate synthase/dihydrofolate synthase [Pelagibacteraceae bacterium]
MKSKTEKLLDDLITLHPKYIDLNLERLEQLLIKLGNPHLNLPKTIHIAGTNGKGSTQSFIRNILVFNGYSCDAYISPHLTKFNERIILNNKEVGTNKLISTLEFVKKINNNNPITFFEITTAAAFILFEKSNSDFL